MEPVATLPIQLLSRIAGNNFSISFATDPCANYTVKRATDLAAQNWVTFSNVIMTELLVPLSGNDQQYFRVTRP